MIVELFTVPAPFKESQRECLDVLHQPVDGVIGDGTARHRPRLAPVDILRNWVDVTIADLIKAVKVLVNTQGTMVMWLNRERLMTMMMGVVLTKSLAATFDDKKIINILAKILSAMVNCFSRLRLISMIMVEILPKIFLLL